MHTTMQAKLVAGAIVAMSLAADAADTVAGPCDSNEHRQFDFWMGDWNVYTPGGKLAGVNSISREYGGCVLHERYSTERGYAGESLNAYDAGRKVWHQTWVDTDGTLLLLEGGLRRENMVLEGQVVGPKGEVTKHRITWTPNADGTVRQHWETSEKQGAWTTAFDGTYKRK
ncbi:MAG TPA: hypothetical protein VGE08_06005 [Steroidobacter sp.]|uniref:hypothetical protein n=1 Tax=Steroidobacter sp. TaxID=1978227 RepID=UPI002ED77D96